MYKICKYRQEYSCLEIDGEVNRRCLRSSCASKPRSKTCSWVSFLSLFVEYFAAVSQIAEFSDNSYCMGKL